MTNEAYKISKSIIVKNNDETFKDNIEICNELNKLHQENVMLHVKLDFSIDEAEDYKHKYFNLKRILKKHIKENKILTLTDMRGLI